MSITMDKKKLTALACELAKDIKTSDDLSALSAELTKRTVEVASNIKLESHLGYDKASFFL